MIGENILGRCKINDLIDTQFPKIIVLRKQIQVVKVGAVDLEVLY